MKPLVVAVALTVCSSLSVLAQQPPAPNPADDDVSTTARTVFPAALAGRWSSAPFEVELTSDFHRSVYGGSARSVRSVAMTINPSGDGVFTVTNRVRDGRGREVAGTRELEELRFAVGELVEEPGRQPHYMTRVARAERRFADDPASAFPLDGAKLAIYLKEGKPVTVEVRFDTPEGTGSFWETLRRQGAAATRP
jgi:hypothetical protein